MELHVTDRMETGATVVSNEFIDNYMAEANGEYVKVYLYLLRRGADRINVEEIADALNDTEADVNRALTYWRNKKVLHFETPDVGGGRRDNSRTARTAKQEQGSSRSLVQEEGRGGEDSRGFGQGSGEDSRVSRAVRPDQEGTRVSRTEPQEKRGPCTAAELEQLSTDAEFTQLLYIAQQYLKKVFTPKDCEVFAYLYGKLEMTAELLEYLVEYCAQNNHTSLRYIEKVALSWHEKRIRSVEEAKAYSRSFSKDSFAVMKAFGLTGRSPADTEYNLLEKWFRSYGFTRELVLEACNRTMNAIHEPSFQYADRILTDWKEAGVRAVRDLAELDRVRQEQKGRAGGGQQADGQKTRSARGAKASNRFHNLEEHGYDYDKMVWSMINSGQEKEN